MGMNYAARLERLERDHLGGGPVVAVWEAGEDGSPTVAAIEGARISRRAAESEVDFLQRAAWEAAKGRPVVWLNSEDARL